MVLKFWGKISMGIRISFEDEMVRDVKDIQAAILIEQVLLTLEINFEKIIIESIEGDQLDVVGLCDEDLERWR